MGPAIDSYREVASSLEPQAVSEYLSLSPWRLEDRNTAREIWRLAGTDGELIGRLMLPLEKDYSDYGDRFYDALLILAQVNHWNADQLQETILSTRTDLFLIRLDQATADGTIPFRQAESTIEAIYKIFLSAANSIAVEEIPRRSAQRAAVKKFLDDDVRLGHTKRGSFIFTIATRLSDGTSADRPLAGTGADSALFPRRVMETIAVDLQALAVELEANQVNVDDKAHDYFEPTTEDVIISTALLESLEAIIRPEEIRSVEFSFKWAISAPSPALAAIRPFKINRSAMAVLSKFQERPQRELMVVHDASDPRVTIVGPVFSVVHGSTEEGSGQLIGVVTVTDLSKRKPRQVRVTLSGTNRDLAIQAYESRLPLKVSGYLSSEPPRWLLTGNIEVAVLDVEAF